MSQLTQPTIKSAFEVSHGVGEEIARPTVWLYEGSVDHEGESFAFWYEADERDGDRTLEFTHEDPTDRDSFDVEAFEAFCEVKVQAQMNLFQLDHDYSVDWSYTNGVLRSSKEISTVYSDKYGRHFSIFHGIDGTQKYFSREGITQVMEGTRDAWDGDLDD